MIGGFLTQMISNWRKMISYWRKSRSSISCRQTCHCHIGSVRLRDPRPLELVRLFYQFMGEYFGILHALDDLGSPWLIASSIRPQFWYDGGVSQVVVEVVVNAFWRHLPVLKPLWALAAMALAEVLLNVFGLAADTIATSSTKLKCALINSDC